MSVFESPSYDRHEQVVFHSDSASGLKAIIALHNTRLGPGLGGCRMYPYANSQAALEDVLRLSRGMTYKSALAGLPYGGGKAVIIGDPRRDKTRDKLLAMGAFIDSLGGRYITAEDSGTGVDDMRVIAEKTAFVSGISGRYPHAGDPSPYTAYGVYCGIKAALRYRFGSDSLRGRRVAIQGAGAVGMHLLQRLVDEGARVYIADLSVMRLEQAQKLGGEIVDPAKLLSMAVDVLAPCAMGAVINDDTVDTLRADIIAGSANNQLLRAEHGERLRRRGILYAPDFVINAGGIIEVHYQLLEGDALACERHIESIAGVLSNIFARAESEGASTEVVAECLAEERIRARDTSPADYRSLSA